MLIIFIYNYNTLCYFCYQFGEQTQFMRTEQYLQNWPCIE